jgi:hypothetical protein
MKGIFPAALIGLTLVITPMAFAADRQKKPMDDDMRRAIEFQRQKDTADARQARMEARHPTVTQADADRRAEDRKSERTVKDPGEAAVQRDKKK